MAHPIVLSRFKDILAASQGSGSEFQQDPLIVIHAPNHFPYMSVAHKLNMEVLISSIDLTKGLINKWDQIDRPVILLIEHGEVEQVEAAVTSRQRSQKFYVFFVQ